MLPDYSVVGLAFDKAPEAVDRYFFPNLALAIGPGNLYSLHLVSLA